MWCASAPSLAAMPIMALMCSVGSFVESLDVRMSIHRAAKSAANWKQARDRLHSDALIANP
jgi:hypothetical protein